MASEKIFQACREALAQSPNSGGEYIDRGTLLTENLLICAVCNMVGAQAVIESGRFRGHSTKALAEFFQGSDVAIESVDLDERTAVEVLGLSREEISEAHGYAEKELAPYPNVKLHYGNAFHVLEPIVKRYHAANQKVALFIDGPKEKAAVDLAVSLPRFSVILPTHNRLYCLLEALESVRRQSFTDYEVVVVHDGSTDGTADAAVREFTVFREQFSGNTKSHIQNSATAECGPGGGAGFEAASWVDFLI